MIISISISISLRADGMAHCGAVTRSPRSYDAARQHRKHDDSGLERLRTPPRHSTQRVVRQSCSNSLSLSLSLSIYIYIYMYIYYVYYIYIYIYVYILYYISLSLSLSLYVYIYIYIYIYTYIYMYIYALCLARYREHGIARGRPGRGRPASLTSLLTDLMLLSLSSLLLVCLAL